ncbi:MAG: phosphotransferase [Candidatus Marinimicrobia bacterium]|nr:phosphotransferase [Candidatus Neomarinimicrobiota bacterium]
MLDSDTVRLIFEKFDGSLEVNKFRDFGGSGLYNELYLVEANGTADSEFVLRIAPADHVPKLFYEEKMMHSEPAIHQKVREATSLPVPEIYQHDFSRDVINRDYLIMEKMPGRSGEFRHEELGRYVRELHQIQGEQFGYPDRGLKSQNTWLDTVLDYTERIFGDCLECGAINRDEFDWFMSVYQDQCDIFEAVEPALLHLDLWSANILTEQGEISAILDFDRGLYGDPELEFAVLDTYGYSTDAFFRGYGTERPAGRAAEIRQRLYYVYEIIKYAYIRLARGGSRPTARRYVDESRRILSEIR